MTEPQTIDLTPVTNDERVKEYAEGHNTQRPWDHMAGQLAALSALADELSTIEEEAVSDVEAAQQFVSAFQNQHRRVSNEFLGFFGEAP